MKNILEIYKKRKYNEFLIDKRKKEADVTDEYTKLADDYNSKLLEMLKAEGREDYFADYKIDVVPTSKATEEALANIEKDFKDKMDDRDRLIEEVNALIQICETSEEEIAVYKKFGILDKNGKIYDYR